jgi:F0F1-type ATP synthase assembly protein I
MKTPHTKSTKVTKEYWVVQDFGQILVTRPGWYPDWFFDRAPWFILLGILIGIPSAVFLCVLCVRSL